MCVEPKTELLATYHYEGKSVDVVKVHPLDESYPHSMYDLYVGEDRLNDMPLNRFPSYGAVRKHLPK